VIAPELPNTKYPVNVPRSLVHGELTHQPIGVVPTMGSAEATEGIISRTIVQNPKSGAKSKFPDNLRIIEASSEW
jgi:hypothetical protein